MRDLLCALGFHRFKKVARQTFCLNYPSMYPLEFNTKYYYECRCGLRCEKWREDHYLNDDTRAQPWGVLEKI